MARPTWPHHPQVYVLRWHQQGGRPNHRFYFRRWYAERRANALREDGYDAHLYTAHTTWTELPPRWGGANT